MGTVGGSVGAAGTCMRVHRGGRRWMGGHCMLLQACAHGCMGGYCMSLHVCVEEDNSETWTCSACCCGLGCLAPSELPANARPRPARPRLRPRLPARLPIQTSPPVHARAPRLVPPPSSLQVRHDILDWHGDHPHTNFHDLYDSLRLVGPGAVDISGLGPQGMHARGHSRTSPHFSCWCALPAPAPQNVQACLLFLVSPHAAGLLAPLSSPPIKRHHHHPSVPLLPP